ncbi:MAG TPA: hypothetical protein VJ957_11025 [Longimicrobiales bacterium]|nr:hypothetical protein [Longimicrobiales bacterium]
MRTINRFLVSLLVIPALAAWALPAKQVKIDVEPNSSSNSITLPGGMGGGMGSTRLPVAVLSTKSFDATMVKPSTARLSSGGMASSMPSGYNAPTSSVRDVNGDGHKDMVLTFNVSSLAKSGTLTPSTSQLCLNAKTDEGTAIHGCDSVNVMR